MLLLSCGHLLILLLYQAREARTRHLTHLILLLKEELIELEKLLELVWVVQVWRHRNLGYPAAYASLVLLGCDSRGRCVSRSTNALLLLLLQG